MTFTYVTLTRDYDTATGLDPEGTVSFQLAAPMVNAGVTIVASKITVPLDVDGLLSVTLAATTDPGTSPSNNYYTVTEKITGQAPRSYSVAVPHNAGASVALDGLTAITAPAALSYPTPGPTGPVGPTAHAVVGTAVALGDSNTARPPDGAGSVVNGEAVDQTPAWFPLLCMLSLGRVRHRGLYARSGYTTAQVRDTHLSAVLALDPAPGACLINLGTNDIALGAGATFDLAAATAAYVDILTQLSAAEILPIICLPIPCSVNSTIQANQQQWNRRLRQLAEIYRCPLIDFYAPLLDATTGGMPATYQTGDATHATALGRRVMASAAVAQGVGELFPPAQVLTAKWGSDPSNALPNGLFLAGSGTGWATDGTAGTITYPTPSAGDALAGQWQQIAANTAGVRNGRRTNSIPSRATLGWNIGDLVEFTCRVQTTGVEAAAAAALNPDVYIGLRFDTVGNTAISFAYGLYGGSGSRQPVDVADGLLRVRATIPATCENFRVYASVDGADATRPITLRFGEVTLRNLTALGIYVP